MDKLLNGSMHSLSKIEMIVLLLFFVILYNTLQTYDNRTIRFEKEEKKKDAFRQAKIKIKFKSNRKTKQT